jgi:translocation and assembly module TamB
VTPFGQVEGAGPVTDLAGTPRFDLKGTLSPDWKALSELLARKLEPNASITGSPRTWRVAGTLPKSGSKDLLATCTGELGVNLDQVDVFGMRLERTAVVLRLQDGKARIDPIDSTLNAGRLHLEPDVITDKQGQTWLHLGASSGLLDAVVNDEVSHRVLMFVAPVLDQATRVRGRVSLSLNEAFLPISAGPDAQAKIDGDVLFDSVEFMPGPLAEQIMGVFRQEQRPLLVLRDPVSIRVVGRKIYQEGLVIPLGNVAAIGIEGWVDFDQNLNLVASFAMAPPRRNIPVLSDILQNTQIQVPITGTFKKPRIDGEAIKERFKDLGVNILDNLIGAGVNAGVNGLGRILQGGPGRNGPPRDFFPPLAPPGDDRPVSPPPRPGAPEPREVPPGGGGATAPDSRRNPPVPENPDDELDQPKARPGQLTPEQRQMQREERRLQRLEKRAERRLRRGLPPE